MTESRIIRPYPGFIIPPRRFVDVGMPRSGVTMSGRYQIRVLDAYGIEKRRTPWFDNIILDSGLNRWGSGTIIGGAAIGTSSTTPAASDTGLGTQSHFTSTAGVGANLAAGTSPNYNNTRTFVYRTTLGALNGNYTEVGVGWASGSMFSRALILDGGGTPTSLSVSSSEQLDIFYQLSVYPPIVDIGPTTVTISGVNYDVTGRSSYVSNISQVWTVGQGQVVFTSSGGFSQFVYAGPLGLITAGPSGAGATGGTIATSAYVNNSLEANGTWTYALDSGNVSGGIGASFAGSSLGAFQYQFSPVIPKNNTKTLVLNYRQGWARR